MYMRLQPICPAAPVITTRIGSAMIVSLEKLEKTFQKNFLEKTCCISFITQLNVTTGQLPGLSLTEVIEKTPWDKI